MSYIAHTRQESNPRHSDLESEYASNYTTCIRNVAGLKMVEGGGEGPHKPLPPVNHSLDVRE